MRFKGNAVLSVEGKKMVYAYPTSVSDLSYMV